MQQTDRIPEAVKRPVKIVTVPGKTTVSAAAKKMRDNGVGCLIVNDDNGKVIGIVTERDIVGRVVAGTINAHQTPIESIMTKGVISCPSDSSMINIQKVMMKHRVRHLPVIDDGVAVAMISTRDVMARQLSNNRAMRAAAEQVAKLSTHLKSLDFDEVVNMVTEEVPKMFKAERCVLSIPEDGHPDTDPFLVARHKCHCPLRDMWARADMKKASDRSTITLGRCPSVCKKLGGKSQTLIIPLDVTSTSEKPDVSAKVLRGALCMCGLKISATATKQLIWYKGALIREILNANLTNARLYQEARRRSLTDALTGVGTRRLFEEKLEAECVRAKRYKRPFCVAIADVDLFKLINDRLGHSAGDRALRTLALCLNREKRATDALARYGGDEFVLLMPETQLDDAFNLLERIRDRVARIHMPDGVPITISCGVVEQPSGTSVESANELNRRADLALYEAKRRGRNRTETWVRVSTDLQRAAFIESEKVKELQKRISGLSTESKEMFIQSTYGLAQALGAKDPHSKSHSENVTRYAVGIAETMGFSSRDVGIIRRAGIVHDIGKIGVPDAILLKPGKLTLEERRVMEQHPMIAVRILERMPFMEQEIPVVRHHHERWDGQGYPDGVPGAAIPLGARVLGVADAFDAITSDRVYHDSLSVPDAMQALIESAGYQFDPDIVEGMKRWVEKVSRTLDKEGDITIPDLLHAQEPSTVTV